MSIKRIGILTGGGDVPGLNSVIKTVVYRGGEVGCEVIGIRRGRSGAGPGDGPTGGRGGRRRPTRSRVAAAAACA